MAERPALEESGMLRCMTICDIDIETSGVFVRLWVREKVLLVSKDSGLPVGSPASIPMSTGNFFRRG